MTAQPNEEREMLMDANGRMLRRCPECRKEHGGTKKREWWTGEEYWEEGVSAGGDDTWEPKMEKLLAEQERMKKNKLSDAEKVVMLLAKVGDMNNDDHRSMASIALKNLDQQRHADYIASLLSKIQHLEEELEDAHAAYGRANAKAMGLV